MSSYMLSLEEKCTNVKRTLFFEEEIVGNQSVSLNITFSKNKKTKHCIKKKTHKLIALRSRVESDVNPLFRLNTYHICVIYNESSLSGRKTMMLKINQFNLIYFCKQNKFVIWLDPLQLVKSLLNILFFQFILYICSNIIKVVWLNSFFNINTNKVIVYLIEHYYKNII